MSNFRLKLTSLIDSYTINSDRLFPLVEKFGLDWIIWQENTDSNAVDECHASTDPEETLPDVEVVGLDKSDAR
jgi:hypothetical protein